MSIENPTGDQEIESQKVEKEYSAEDYRKICSEFSELVNNWIEKQKVSMSIDDRQKLRAVSMYISKFDKSFGSEKKSETDLKNFMNSKIDFYFKSIFSDNGKKMITLEQRKYLDILEQIFNDILENK